MNPTETGHERDHQGSAFKGIAIGLLLAIPFWALLAVVVWQLFFRGHPTVQSMSPVRADPHSA